MIRVREGAVRIEGNTVTILADLTMICKALLNNGFDRDDLERCIELADTPEDEIVSEAMQFVEKMFKDILKHSKGDDNGKS